MTKYLKAAERWTRKPLAERVAVLLKVMKKEKP